MERTYGLTELLAALRRRQVLAVAVASGVLLLGAAIALLVPSEYVAQSVVQVEPHRLPADFFPAQPLTSYEDRMRTVKHGVLARPVLERVVRETDFFPDLHDRLDEAVDRMRRAVEVRLEGEVPGGPPSLLFVVEVRGRDPEKVAKAAELLPRYYAEMTRQVFVDQARSLRKVLDAQVGELGRSLTDGEAKLLAFKTQHASELPESIETNSRVAGRAQALIEIQLGAIADARRRRDDVLGSIPEAPSEPGMAQAGLDLARRKLEAAEAAYGPRHPDVRRARREYADALAHRKTELDRFRTERVDASVERLDAEVREHEAELAAARADMAAAQKRLEAAPRWGQELAALSRDYETLRAKYVTTVARRADAAAAEDLLAADSGLFRVLQPAVVPGRPAGPDRARLLWLALAAALAAALGTVTVVEWLDTSLRGAEDAGGFGVPVLATIPRIGPRGRTVTGRTTP
jgi:uncharacterized protein involved in exopolysaccharide biosynthesis